MFELVPTTETQTIDVDLTATQCGHLQAWLDGNLFARHLNLSSHFPLIRFADQFDFPNLAEELSDMLQQRCIRSGTWTVFVAALQANNKEIAKRAAGIMGQKTFTPAKYRLLSWAEMDYATEVQVSCGVTNRSSLQICALRDNIG